MIQVDAVIGANYGDEGKGAITDYLAYDAATEGQNSLVVLHNGGPQRGHTVVTPEGTRHIFKHIGAGTFAGSDTFLAGTFLVNPMELRREVDELDSLGVPLNYKIYIAPTCQLTTHMDMMANQIREEWRGNKNYGSCGMGIWETVLRNKTSSKYGYGCPLRICDVWKANPLLATPIPSLEDLWTSLNRVREYYLKQRFSDLTVSTDWMDLFQSSQMDEHYIQDFLWMATDPRVKILSYDEIFDLLTGYDRLIFESGQGLLLDGKLAYGQENNTPSNTDSTNAITMTNWLVSKGASAEIRFIYVSRPYITRHGKGLLKDECDKRDISLGIGRYGETNQENKFQGHLRYAPLDLEELKKRLKEDYRRADKRSVCKTTSAFALTHVDEMPVVKNADALYMSCITNTRFHSYIVAGDATRIYTTEYEPERY